MGWDYTHATHYTKAGAIDRKAEVDEHFNWSNEAQKVEVVRFTLQNGECIELLKHAAAYQFKRPFWFCQSSGCYMPATRIPANYEVITA